MPQNARELRLYGTFNLEVTAYNLGRGKITKCQKENLDSWLFKSPPHYGRFSHYKKHFWIWIYFKLHQFSLQKSFPKANRYKFSNAIFLFSRFLLSLMEISKAKARILMIFSFPCVCKRVLWFIFSLNSKSFTLSIFNNRKISYYYKIISLLRFCFMWHTSGIIFLMKQLNQLTFVTFQLRGFIEQWFRTNLTIISAHAMVNFPNCFSENWFKFQITVIKVLTIKANRLLI